MTTCLEVIDILKKYKNENADKYGIHAIGVFGSFARNEAKEESDVDIVLETETPNLFKVVHIKEELENIFHRPVDIVRNRERMNPYLKKHIEKEAVYV